MTKKLPANQTPPAKEGAPGYLGGTGYPTAKELVNDVKEIFKKKK
ncbi:hypothetical protein [Microcoleus sp. MON2_D5]